MKNCGGVEQLQQNNETVTQAIERINTAIEALQNASTGAVRHIQRGVLSYSGSTETQVVVELSGFTNLDKMIVLINGSRRAYSDITATCPYLYELTTTSCSIRLMPSSSASGDVSYQVIEFY
ncbi:MAG: hypothetical protein ACI4E1_07835 [Lachnospira sp.]